MKQIQPDLWETESFSPFPGLKTHAYLLTRSEGNVLFYNTGHSHEVRNLATLGGVTRQYLSHEDELGETLNEIAELYGAELWGHQAEAEAFAKVRSPDGYITGKDTHLGNIELIPTPGHTAGSTCFLVHSPTGKDYLFTGDTLFLNGINRWTAGFIASIHSETDKRVLSQSLQVLRELRPDIVAGSGYAGDYGFETVTKQNWPAKVDDAIDRLLAKPA